MTSPLLKFPISDAESELPYKGSIRFTARKPVSFDLSGIIKATSSLTNLQELLTDNSAEGQELIDQATANLQNQVQSHKGLQNQSDRVKGTGLILEREDNPPSAELYLPQQIQINDAVTYDNTFQLGIGGALASEGLASGQSIAAAALAQGSEAIRGFVDTMLSGANTDQAKVIASRTAQATLGQQLSGAVLINTQVTVNPNVRALFSSVPLRQFNFNFKMVPRSAEEQRSIKAIIKFFRTHLYPEVIRTGSGEGAVAIGYKFPKVFTIDMSYNQKRIGPKLLPCYLSNFAVVYNENGMGFYENNDGSGEFSESSVSLTMIEAHPLHKELVEKEDY